MTLADHDLCGRAVRDQFPPGDSSEWTNRREQVFGHLLEGAVSFSLPLLAILVAHELGHYLVCRRYGIDASPPYFIPFLPQISLVGTMGAFIRIREPIRDKKQLFDMAVAGPIAGFAVAVPLLAWGVSHSRVNPVPVLGDGTVIFQYPILVQLFQRIFVGATYTSVDVIEHPVFLAAWFGLFVTALNLLPLGQLDGGHTVYAVFGRFQRLLAIPLLIVLAVLGLKWPGWWVWVLFTLFTGIRPSQGSERGRTPRRPEKARRRGGASDLRPLLRPGPDRDPLGP